MFLVLPRRSELPTVRVRHFSGEKKNQIGCPPEKKATERDELEAAEDELMQIKPIGSSPAEKHRKGGRNAPTPVTFIELRPNLALPVVLLAHGSIGDRGLGK